MIIKKKNLTNDEVVTLKHATKTTNVPSILKNGILGSYTNTEGTLLGKSKVPKDEMKRNLVYLAKTDKVANRIKGAIEGRLNSPTTILEINIPKEDYSKLKIVDNPEFMGAKNLKDWIKKIENKIGKKITDLTGYKEYWEDYHDNTVVIEGDIDPKYIKR